MTNNLQIGLKIWSINDAWFAEAIDFYQRGIYEFIELYVVPGSFSIEKLHPLKDAQIPVNIHAPNEPGFNLMEDKKQNFTIFEEVIEFADYFHSEYIIAHPGGGLPEKISRQTLFTNLKKMDDPRLVIENLPYKSMFAGEVLYGYSFAMMEEILDYCQKGFCLDFTHAIKAAKSQGIDGKEFISQLMKLKPKVFHISDGDEGKEADEHLNLGEGPFDLKFNKDCVVNNFSPMAVMETPKLNQNLQNDLRNINYFRNL